MSVLQTLAEASAARTAREKRAQPLAAVRAAAQARPPRGAEFLQALKRPGVSFVCEVKRASPSQGVIAQDFPYLEIARDYAAAGAAAVSVLTEPEYFLGSDEILRQIAAEAPLPALRKDFLVDEYQLYQAAALGAAAVLLICALLPREKLRAFLQLARTLGLAALVETHSAAEVDAALWAGADIVGVNNRDLATFVVDAGTCLRLRPLVPRTCVFVAESGVRTREDVVKLAEGGVDAVLVGETLMRAPNRRAALKQLRGA